MKRFVLAAAAATLALSACSETPAPEAEEVVVVEEDHSMHADHAEGTTEESNVAEIVNDDLVVEEGYLAEGESQGTVTIE